MKITFLGAGSTVFAKNVLGDCILTLEQDNFELALFDIDHVRLNDTFQMISLLYEKYGKKATVVAYKNRKEALKGAEFVVNAIQVGGYKPSTVIDFEIPKKYGLRQTIADTLGIGGIFRGLRTIPVMHDFANDMQEVCPDALFLNYTNPMAILTGYMARNTKIKTVGLCHSVQGCVPDLFKMLGMTEYTEKCKWKIAGINHMAWLYEITDENGKDLYPEIKKRALQNDKYDTKHDTVRLKIMNTFGFYNTESSEHTAEYHPWFIKSRYENLIKEYNIPLDEYIARCERQIANWEKDRKQLVENKNIEHKLSQEYASKIITAVKTGKPARIHGNVLNNGLITNLPDNACVEVPIMFDRNGINPVKVGEIPEQCACLNRSNINTQLMTIKAATELKKEYIYMAAMMDPHTGSELSIDDIVNLCNELIEAHGDYLPKYN